MKINVFKQLIKEAVAEAVREELLAIMNSEPKKQVPTSLKEMKTVNFKSEDIHEILDARTQLKAKMDAAFGFNKPVSIHETQTTNMLEPVIDPTGENPYLNFIMDAAANMTVQDKAGLRNLE